MVLTGCKTGLQPHLGHKHFLEIRGVYTRRDELACTAAPSHCDKDTKLQLAMLADRREWEGFTYLNRIWWLCCRESAASRLALSLSPFVSWVSAALKMKQLISNGDVVIPDGEPAAGPMRRPHRPQTQGTCCAHRSLRWISLLASLRAWDRTCSGRQQDKQQVAAACRLLGCSTTVRPQAANRSSFG